MSAINKLIDEYRAWCAENGLPFIDANKNLRSLIATDCQSTTQIEQGKWLTDFLQRWDAAHALRPTVRG